MIQKCRPLHHLTLLTPLSALALFAGLELGCATTPSALQAASSIPAGEGTVQATLGANGNTDLSLRVKHLAPASRMASDATVYVVWIQPFEASSQNVGALTLSEDLEGRLDTVTPHRRFLVMVTPEPSSRMEKPTHEAVFTARVDGVK